MSDGLAVDVVALTARDAYGRLLAWLSARTGSLERAEDALGDALEAALVAWPSQGVPDNPEAWLLTAAKRRVIDRVRRGQTRERGAVLLRQEALEAVTSAFVPELPDRRLELMLVCAHPEVPANMRTPLMLQVVLGLDATQIAGAMLVKPATMAQRLVRVKRTIAELGVPFEVPEPEMLPQRLEPVLEAIYGAYGTGWAVAAATPGASTGLADEALFLGRLVVHLVPQSAEAKGLLALMLYSASRRDSGRDAEGRFVPLDEQDPGTWDTERILEAEKALWMAARLRQPGPFQLEASIQSLHAHRARGGTTDWAAIVAMYRTLERTYPSLGASIGLAATLSRLGQVEEGLAVLDALPGERVDAHQPYWAVRAHLLAELGRVEEAVAAYERAAGLTEDPAVRAWLLGRQRATSAVGSLPSEHG